MKTISTLLLILFTTACNSSTIKGQDPLKQQEAKLQDSIPSRNKQVIDTIVRYGPTISSTYKKAVCTELIIPIIERFYKLNKTDKSRIRIITNENVQSLLAANSPIPKGVCNALVKKGIGTEIENIGDVRPGDFVQFWTNTWGHCGVVKDIDIEKNTITMYSSFPSTNGYGIQKFAIPQYVYFVRLK